MTIGGLPTRDLDRDPISDLPDSPPPPPDWRLVITGPEQMADIPLQPGGEYTIGRGAESEIQLADQSASRPHARLRVRDAFIEVEDLDSQNGTTVAAAILKKTKQRELLFPDQTMKIGLTTLLAQRFTASARRRQKLRTHLYFRVRVEEECERAELVGFPFSIVRLSPAATTESRAAAAAELGAALVRVLDPSELFTRFGSHAWDLLLRGDRARCELRLEAICRALGSTAKDMRWRMATFGSDGRDPDALFAAVARGLHGDAAAPGGSLGPGLQAPPSGPMREILDVAGKVAASLATVLILGETGVGKSSLARWIHEQSARRKERFIIVELPRIPRDMIESELFGHVRGAFTGAIATTTGLLAQADGGTVFLDEIGELPPDLQAKLLGFLDRREVRRLGDTAVQRVDVRIIAATNRDLRVSIAKGEFRQDLYRRLNVVRLVLPPLRRRRGEIEPLALAFLKRFADREKRPAPALSPEALLALEAHEWPQNVGELEATMERALAFCDGTVIEPEDLALTDALYEPAVAAPSEAGGGAGNADEDESDDVSDLSAAQLAERRLMIKLLEKHQWRRDEACRDEDSPWGRTTFYKKMKILRVRNKKPK